MIIYSLFRGDIKIWMYCFLIIFGLAGCQKDSLTLESTVDKWEFEGRFLYSKNPKGHNEIYLWNNGIESLILSDSSYDYWWPKVHPDKSKMIVYRSPTNPDKNHDDYPNAELLLVDIDGTNIETIIRKDDYDWNAHGVARWSPDGDKILMAAEFDVGFGKQWRMIITDSMGKNAKILADRWAIDCNFSPDGRSVVFIGFKDNNLTFDLTKLEVLIGDYDQQLDQLSNIRTLTENNTRDHDPDFSPDGTQLMFSAGNASYSNVDLVLLNLDSNLENTVLDDNAANGGSMCWSMDGVHVLFHSLNLFESPFAIKSLNTETRQTETLLMSIDNSYGYYHPETF